VGLKEAAARIKQELAVYRLVLKHERTPRLARVLLAAAVGYLVMPFDLIPDWIPVVGHLDDVVIVSGLALLALRMIPREVVAECREEVSAARAPDGGGMNGNGDGNH
jgi:uncharacterized membrane protein YkvA (DUF1232 family)